MWCVNWLLRIVLVGTAFCSAGCYGLRSCAIPDRLPIGAIERAHFHNMQTNAEATDFILHRHDFVGDTAELTPDGRDHIMEIAARMRSAPFPVLVERSENNSNPQLDIERRQMTALVLTDFGNADAEQRTFVAPAYSDGINSGEAEFDYYRYLYSRGGFGGFGGNFNNSFGGFGGFGSGGYGFGR